MTQMGQNGPSFYKQQRQGGRDLIIIFLHTSIDSGRERHERVGGGACMAGRHRRQHFVRARRARKAPPPPLNGRLKMRLIIINLV
jgi:hypothetical protein